MDLFSPTGKVLKTLVHFLRWTTFPGGIGQNFGWVDRTLYSRCFLSSPSSPTPLILVFLILGSAFPQLYLLLQKIKHTKKKKMRAKQAMS